VGAWADVTVYGVASDKDDDQHIFIVEETKHWT